MMYIESNMLGHGVVSTSLCVHVCTLLQCTRICVCSGALEYTCYNSPMPECSTNA